MNKKIFILVSSVWLISSIVICKEVGQLYNNLPSNVHASYAWGIQENAGLTIEDLKRMATMVLVRNYEKNETQAQNEVNQFSESKLKALATEEFQVDYVEVPEEKIMSNVDNFLNLYSKKMSVEAKDSPLRFLQNGNWHVRWFIHPLRSDLSFLEALGKPQIKRGKFLAQLTESRSMVLMDRENGNFWSLKVGLPKAYGAFPDKSYKLKQAKFHFSMSEYLLVLKNRNHLQETEFAPELHAIGFQKEYVDEAQTLRSLSYLKNGNYLLSFSSIYTRGLGYFLNENYTPEKLKELEINFLSTAPGVAAANLYKVAGLSLNSNHSQNSTLLLSPERHPLAFLRRDLDFDLDPEHPKAHLITNLVPEFNRGMGFKVDFSMMNGFTRKNVHYNEKDYFFIVRNFVQAFFDRYQDLRGQPRESGSVLPYILHLLKGKMPEKLNMEVASLNTEGSYSIVPTHFKSKAEVDLLLKRHAEEEKEKYKKMIPSLTEMETNPRNAIEGIFLRSNQKMGDIASLAPNLFKYFGSKALNGWNILVEEAINDQNKNSSPIWSVVRSKDNVSFWNFCIFVGAIYSPSQEEFIKKLIDESTIQGNQKSIIRFFNNLQKRSGKPVYLMKSSDYNLDYIRLLEYYISKSDIHTQRDILNTPSAVGIDVLPEVQKLFFSVLKPELLKEVEIALNHEKIQKSGPSKYQQYEPLIREAIASKIIKNSCLSFY